MHAVRFLCFPFPYFSLRVAAALAAGAAAVSVARAQDVSIILHGFPANVVLPQRRVIEIWPAPRPRPEPERVQISGVEADISIKDGIATTALTIRLFNPGHARTEAVVLLPVPDAAVVRAFTFDGLGSDGEAKLLPRDEARRIYDAIVARAKDPALLEFAGLNVVRSSAFPIEPHAKQSVTLTYEQVLPADGDRRDYVLPRSEALDCEVPWQIKVRVQDRRAIGAIYSPSHEIDVERRLGDAHHATITLGRGAGRSAGSFILSYLTQREDGPAATVFLHPDAKGGGGYFLLLAGAPQATDRTINRLRREVTLVLDRSGSMRGEKLEQAREAARQLIAGLEPGERFHLITYNEVIETCSDAPEFVSPESRKRALQFIDEITARGGTNIHDALREALRIAPAEGFVPMVLFLTDGLPTVGPTSEKAIRELALARNPYGRRIFTFGVGAEVNTPLLQGLALAARGTPTFVLPGEDIEVKMSAVFRRLAGPVLADPILSAENDGAGPRRIFDVVPTPLPDIFAGDETLIFGRYRGDRPFDLVLKGAGGWKNATVLRAHVDPGAASVRNSFVPRLWASRRIGLLMAAVRDLGVDDRDPHQATHDPAARELIDEIVKLSTEFGILTEYTSFLADDAKPLPTPAVAGGFARESAARSAPARSGAESLSMDANNSFKLQQKAVNPTNRVYRADLTEREVRSIQQISDRAFYQRGARWIDSRLAATGALTPTPSRIVEPGTADHRRLVDQLVRENRQAIAALPGDVYLELEGETVLLRNGTP